ncbi:MAG: PHP domain-containing protein [Candidatus Aminicenantes bacterium]|nr:PHP domain-containing protein [Candidatus Aminicenantes bacterium]
MRDGLVDLHIHSCWSGDGDVRPEELVRRAKESGFAAISIADHDSIKAYPAALAAGEEQGVEVIPGLEMTTQYDGREFHLLMPFVDWRSPCLAEVLNRAREVRLSEGRERVNNLRRLGFPVSWEEVLAAAAEKGEDVLPVGVFIARVLLDKMEVRREPRWDKYYLPGSNEPDAFLFYSDYFEKGRPAYAPKSYIDLVEVLDLAPQTGASPVLAHPGASFVRAGRRDLEELKERGLKGLEVYTSYHRPPLCPDHSLERHYLGLAESLNLVPTAGSDFHGRIKPFIPFGFVKEGRYWMVERLRNSGA